MKAIATILSEEESCRFDGFLCEYKDGLFLVFFQEKYDFWVPNEGDFTEEYSVRDWENLEKETLLKEFQDFFKKDLEVFAKNGFDLKWDIYDIPDE